MRVNNSLHHIGRSGGHHYRGGSALDLFVAFAFGVFILVVIFRFQTPEPKRRKMKRKLMMKIESWATSAGTEITKDGYVRRKSVFGVGKLVHRVVAEDVLGRHLKRNEVVYHINGKKDDNRATNLCVMDYRDHRRFIQWRDSALKKGGKLPSREVQLVKLREKFNGQLLGEVVIWRTAA